VACVLVIKQMEHRSVPAVPERIFLQSILHAVFYLVASATTLNTAACVMNTLAKSMRAQTKPTHLSYTTR